MPITDTPLRYPGGKSQLSPLVIDILRANNLLYGEYAEVYAGGAGIAWHLLVNNYVSNVYLNDLDPSIYAFWHSVINDTDGLCSLIESTPVTVEEWHKQRLVQKDNDKSILLRGFSTLFLNRTNRSGIIRGGVIGGINQEGNYKIDCRFNKSDLVRKIRRIANHKDRIHLYNYDAVDFIKKIIPKLSEKALVNLDPPYFTKGPGLYTNFYSNDDHVNLSKEINSIQRYWMVTYDDVDELRQLYAHYPMFKSQLNYSAQVKRVGTELLILDPRLIQPTYLKASKIAA